MATDPVFTAPARGVLVQITDRVDPMQSLKQSLLGILASIDGLEARPSVVAGGTALFYRGKEFAHFHHDHEIDLRLTRKVIQALGLAHPTDSQQHPARSGSSPWIEVRSRSPAEIERVAELVKLALEQL